MVRRYETGGNEVEFEPRSRRRVLRNRLGIASVRNMEIAESDALLAAQEWLVRHYTATHRFTADDLRAMHRRWLGGIYDWAGTYRGVNIGKAGFMFAAAPQIPRLMAAFERDCLAVDTPCADMADGRLITALARTHAEFVLIHPFREGNGRSARLLSWLMALQAGLPPLDFTPMAGRGKAATSPRSTRRWTAIMGRWKRRSAPSSYAPYALLLDRRGCATGARRERLADPLDGGGARGRDPQRLAPARRVAQMGIGPDERSNHVVPLAVDIVEKPYRMTRKISSAQSLSSFVKSICDVMRRSNCAGALQYMPELIWILFLPILDARKARARDAAEAVNPRARVERDTRTPSEIIESIAAHGRILHAALEQLRLVLSADTNSAGA